MANINFGLLDTQYPEKLANAFVRSPEQQNANMLQAMQMQGFVNQNELAQSQLRTARRAEEGQALLGQAYAGANFGTGGTAGGMASGAGQSPYPEMKLSVVKKLIGTPSAYLIPGELAKLTEMENKETTNRKAQGEVEKQAREAVDYTLKQYQTEVPRVTDAAGVERWTRATFKDKLLGPIVSRFKTEDQAVADAVNLFNSPGGANKWATQNMGMSADKLVDMLKLTTRTTNLGNVSREVKDDFFGNVVGSAVDTPIGISPNTVATLKQAQDHYNGLSAYQKEQLKTQGISFDSARGVFVNARNNTYSPIDPFASGAPTFTGAPASPAGVAAVPGGAAGSSGGGVPGQRQTPEGRLGPMPAAAAEKALTESQGNATAYGLRMKEAESILEDLAKQGVLRGAMVEGVPFVGGAAGKALPGSLGGTSQQEQQVNQAKSNFITAVLRKESGAVISDSEFAREDNKYFPQVNDGPAVIKQKANARRLAIEAMKFQAGPGAKEIDKYVPNAGTGTSNAPSPSAPPIQSFRRP
jgi:hypothetical protein